MLLSVRMGNIHFFKHKTFKNDAESSYGAFFFLSSIVHMIRIDSVVYLTHFFFSKTSVDDYQRFYVLLMCHYKLVHVRMRSAREKKISENPDKSSTLRPNLYWTFHQMIEVFYRDVYLSLSQKQINFAILYTFDWKLIKSKFCFPFISIISLYRICFFCWYNFHQ